MQKLQFILVILVMSVMTSARAIGVRLGDDIFIATLYEGESVTISKDRANQLSRNCVFDSECLTNSVRNFIMLCKEDSFIEKTNHCNFLDANYERFNFNDKCYWALSLSYFHSRDRKLVQFVILPDGGIVDALPSDRDETYIISYDPIRVDDQDINLLYTGANDQIKIDAQDFRYLFGLRTQNGRLYIAGVLLVVLAVFVIILRSK